MARSLSSHYYQEWWRCCILHTLELRDQPQACELPAVTRREQPQQHEAMRARVLWGRQQCKQGLPIPTQIWAEQEPANLLYADVGKPEPRSIYERCQLFKRLISDRGKKIPLSWKRSDIMMPCFAQRCDTGRPLVCTWVLIRPETVSLSMPNPLLGSGIPASATFQSNSLSLSISSRILMIVAIIAL